MPSKLTLPQWISPQLTHLVETAPSGKQWLHEIKLDGFRMAVRIERGRAKLLTRTGLDWTDKYPIMQTPLAALRAKTGLALGKWRALLKERGAFHGQAAATVREGICGRSRSVG